MQPIGAARNRPTACEEGEMMKRILLLMLCASSVGVLRAQAPDNGTGTITYTNNATISGNSPIIILNGDLGFSIIKINDKEGHLMAEVDPKGRVIYGEGYKPDDAAKTFWEAMARAYPKVCDHPKESK